MERAAPTIPATTVAAASGLPSQSPAPQARRPAATGQTKTKTPGAEPDLVLTADRPAPLDVLSLRPGQTVRGRPGKRPLVEVPRGGVVVRPEGVRFQDIDFVAGTNLRSVPGFEAARWTPLEVVQQTPGADENSAGAVVELHAWRAEFRGCSFQAGKDCRQPPAAIRWCPEVRAGQSGLALPSGNLRLTDRRTLAQNLTSLSIRSQIAAMPPPKWEITNLKNRDSKTPLKN